MNDLVPADGKTPFDIHVVINRLVDDGDFLEVQREWAKNLVVGFARIQGLVAASWRTSPW
jgi:propionyl-CoA carboxylase beta chain